MKGMATLLSAVVLFGLATALAAQEGVTAKDEVQVVEKVAEARLAYQQALEGLVDYYRRIGDVSKKRWAEEELEGFRRLHKPFYLIYTVFISKEKWTNEYVAEAERLYKDGKEQKDFPDLFGKKRHLNIAIDRFTTLLRKYPTSARVPDSLYLLGEIYEGFYFKDLVRAVKYFEKCYEVDPATKYPARIKAARIYHQRLNDLESAIRVYKEVIANDPSPKAKEEAAKALTKIEATYAPPLKREE